LPEKDLIMSRRFAFLSVVALFIGAGWSTAADDNKPKRDPEALFKKLDADGDGKLTLEEFKKLGELGAGKLKDKPELLERIFKKLDANGDSSLTLEEFKKLGELRKKKTDKNPQDK